MGKRPPGMAERSDTDSFAGDRRVFLLFGPYVFDRANQVLSLNGSELPLPPRALKVLRHLVERPGEVVSKQAFMDELWDGAAVTDGSLSEAVRILRQTLGDDPHRCLWKALLIDRRLSSLPNDPSAPTRAARLTPPPLERSDGRRTGLDAEGGPTWQCHC
jgi:hypothetical protein